MIVTQYPAALQFTVPEKVQPFTRTSPVLPEQYRQYRIAFAGTTVYTEGPFGCYIMQELKDANWTIYWLHCFIREKVRLHPTTAHPMLSMCCVLKGSLPCHMQGHGKLMLIEKEFGIYYVPGQSHNTASLRPGNYELVSISLSPSFFGTLAEQHPGFKDMHRQQEKQTRKGSFLPVFRIGPAELKVLDSMRTAPDADKSFLHAQVTELLALYSQALAPRDLSNSEQMKKLQQACAYIAQHYHQPLTIPALSKQAGMHINTFERGLKELTGFSPREYIERLRLEKAAALLLQTTMSIREISLSTGYMGSNYFTVAFKRRYHCSPRTYRKETGRRR